MDLSGIKNIIAAIAPTAGLLIGGPLGGMAGRAIAAAIGVDQAGDPAEVAGRVAQAIQDGNLTGEQLLAMKAADSALKVRLRELDLDEQRISGDLEKAYLTDTQNARGAHAGDKWVFWLGIAILLIFALVMGFSMYGSYQILQGGITIKDVGIVAAVFGFLGTIVGYAAANAQQVVSYFFGSSRGSKEKGDAMGEAIKNFPVKTG